MEGFTLRKAGGDQRKGVRGKMEEEEEEKEEAHARSESCCVVKPPHGGALIPT